MLADRDRLAQVFHNLVRNALQAMASSEGSRLRITTRIDLDRPLSQGDGPPVRSVSIEVDDEGPGIAPELRGRITDPFFTTRESGTGLGLSIAQHWVAAHGGRLSLADAPEGGTRARVTLPLRTSGSRT
jgi:two-component system nitrogen regulation sensor histidine kinase GlnL